MGSGAFLLLLGFERGLVTTPFIANSATRGTSEQSSSARYALTVALMGALAAAVALAVLGVLLPATLGQGLLLFAPWLLPAFVQDLGRSRPVQGRPRKKRRGGRCDVARRNGGNRPDRVRHRKRVGRYRLLGRRGHRLRCGRNLEASLDTCSDRPGFGLVAARGMAFRPMDANVRVVLRSRILRCRRRAGGNSRDQRLWRASSNPITLRSTHVDRSCDRASRPSPHLARPDNFSATRTWRCLATRWSHCNYHLAVFNFPVRLS